MGMRGGDRTYDYETKLAVVRAHVDEGAPAPEIARRYGISTVELLGKWCRAYREGGAEALRPRPKGRPKGACNKAKPLTREQEFERENRLLRAKVAYLGKYHALPAREDAHDGAPH
ncbi:transposase [Bifidobacterium animalis subsp. animalis]|nr:transposase [Bifidobacterium animalis subsp. animalis]